MKIILVIIVFHALVMIRAKYKTKDRVPYFSVFLLTVAMAAGVAFMLATMGSPV